MTDFTPSASCASDELPSVFTVAQAKHYLLNAVSPLTSWHKVALRQALARNLYQDIISPCNVPQHANSAMDGFALKSTDLSADPFTLAQVGTAFAGHPYTATVQSGECVQIMTGGMLPAGCDTVIMQENTQRQANQITFQSEHEAGQNVRLAGEDIAEGAIILKAGKQLTPADIGLLASLGLAEVAVVRPLRVAFFSSGDELKSIGEKLNAGDIYDSNRYTLHSMLQRIGADILDMGVIKDAPEALRIALTTAAQEADVIITSGGVSVGEADFIKQILAKIGEVNFWKIAMKPGRPLAFGHIFGKPFFGLPGNPVSVMVTFYQFVQPALQKMAGATLTEPLALAAIAASPIPKRSGRFEFQRGVMQSQNGQLTVTMTGAQGSGMLSSMSAANCFILLDEQCTGVAAGDTVTIQPFVGLM